MNGIKVLIFKGIGLNSYDELAVSYHQAGIAKENITTIHFEKFLRQTSWFDYYDIVNFPGGFSYGDELGSAKAMANVIKFRIIKDSNGNHSTLYKELIHYRNRGGFILGICNGFQLLMKLGLFEKNDNSLPNITLAHNLSGRFENRSSLLSFNRSSNSLLLKGWPFSDNQFLKVPVRHGEGRIYFDEKSFNLDESQHLFYYYNPESCKVTTDYPYNQNGSKLGLAGLTDPSGQIMGLMPHPESATSNYQNPMHHFSIHFKDEINGSDFFSIIVNNLKVIRQNKISGNKLTPGK